MAVRKQIDILFVISLPIALDDCFSVFKYSSIGRGYHVFKDRWQPTVGDNSLHCEEDKGRVRKTCCCDNLRQFSLEQGCETRSTLLERIGQRIFEISEPSNTFVVTGNRVNQAIGLRLEIPVDYLFQRGNRAIKWFKKSIENSFS